MLDRLDLQVEVVALTSHELLRTDSGESAPSCSCVHPTTRQKGSDLATPVPRPSIRRDGVASARERQRTRGALNSRLTNAVLRSCCAIDDDVRRLIADAMDRGGMSARGIDRALRVARTIADLAGDEQVTAVRLAEALQYRAYESRRLAIS